MPDITIDAAAVQKISSNKMFTNEFLEFLEKEGIGHYGYKETEQEQDPTFVVNGEGVDYYFNDDGSLTIVEDKDAPKVTAAIRKFTKPAEPADPPPSRVRGKLQGAIALAKQLEGTGRRKTRAKKEPKKRKTRKAKKSTRRR